MPEIYRDGELWLYGFVGDSYWDEGFTATEVIEALAEHGRDQDITVHINSGGGYVYDGLAIYNALTAHKGDVRIEVDAIAASAASSIMMAGDHIVMRPGSLVMIHDPSGITMGTAEDHEKQAVALNKIADQMASIYAERAGKDVAGVRSSMREEIWLTAAEAVEEGYADEAEGAKAKAFAAYDYRLYAHAPKHLTALAAKKNWRLPDADSAAPSATATRQPKETPMTDKERADQLAAELAELKANQADTATAASDAVKADRERRASIMSLDEAKGREAIAEQLYAANMTAEQAKPILAAAAKETKPAPTDAELHEQRRLNAEGLNGGGNKQPAQTIKQGWAKAFGRVNA